MTCCNGAMPHDAQRLSGVQAQHLRCYAAPVPKKTARATIRQPTDQAAALMQVAQIDGMTAAEAVRVAVARYIKARHADPQFQARLRERIQADQHVLHRAEGQPA